MKTDWNRVRHIATGVIAVVSAAGTVAGFLPPQIGVPLILVSGIATALGRVMGSTPAP